MRVGWARSGESVGETQTPLCQLQFNSSLRVEFQSARVTSNRGLILVRERGAALTSRLQWFETEMPAQEDNLAGLAALNRAS